MSVIVHDAVWHAALRELDPYPNRPDLLPSIRPGLRPMGYNEYPHSLVQAVVDYLMEDLGCDHQVGICMCSTVEVVNELTLNLQGRETCRGCFGEGFTPIVSEPYEMRPCAHCDRNGSVPAGHDYDTAVGVSEA